MSHSCVEKIVIKDGCLCTEIITQSTNATKNEREDLFSTVVQNKKEIERIDDSKETKE